MTDRRRGLAVAAGALWLAAFAFTFCTIVIHNDHFGRITPGRQIARYGELPFRDYLDPGYFLTEFSSAAVQMLFGDSLLGEVLLNAAFIATGTVLVLLLARRVTGSVVAGTLVASLALLAMPRAYDYDKVLFYPLGLLLCWRYIERRRPVDAVWLGIGIVAAALYRYDSGVYLGAAALAGMAAIHRGDWRALGRGGAACAAAVLLGATPFVLFVHYTAGLADAVDQVVTYGVRESEPLQIFIVDAAPPANLVNVRWAEGVDDSLRMALEAQFGLVAGAIKGAREERTWSYVVAEPSVERLRSLVRDPHVDDTHLIDRERFTLPAETLAARLNRTLPFLRMRMRPDMYESREAAFLYFLLLGLPVAAAVVVTVPRTRPATPVEQACLWSLSVFCVALNLFILRAPIEARIGGMAGPPAVLAAWLARRAWQAVRAPALRHGPVVAVRIAGAAATAALLVLTVRSVSVAGEWPRHLRPEVATAGRIVSNLSAFSASPPSATGLSLGRVEGLVTYIRDCTGPDDRVFTTWFVPELPLLAQRPFGGATWAVFGEHWSDTRYQERTIQALRAQSVPIVLVEMRTYEQFADNYRLLVAYLMEEYSTGGASDFGDPGSQPDGYRVLTSSRRVPTGMHPQWALPCFA